MCCVSAIELPMNMNKQIENSAKIFENMSVVFINFKNVNFKISDRWIGHTTYKNFMTNKFRFWPLMLHFRPHNVYFFEFSLKFLIDG
jgi:hypothetical protein